MAEWNKGKVLPSNINNGQEFITGDNLAINELNAIVNNSFYASEKAENAERLVEEAISGNIDLSNYYTKDETYSKEEVDDLISGIETGGGNSIVVDSELSSTSTNPVQNKVITTAINGLRGFVLWENPNLTVDFSSQTLTLSSADYDYLEWYYKYDTQHDIVSTMKIVKGFGGRVFTVGASSGIEAYFRDLVRYNDTSFRISTCFKAVATTYSESNANIIPIKIVGYKVR